MIAVTALAVNRSKQFARLLRLALVAPQPRETHCGAEFPVKVDMNINQEKPKTTNDLLDRIEQQLGARGRELLTKFIKSLDKLEREEQASDNAQ